MNFPIQLIKNVSFHLLAWMVFSGLSCTPEKKGEVIWMEDFPVTGSESSPRCTDLNGDGILDVVIGAGRNEGQQSVQGVIALDGKSGALLWQQKSNDQMYGSATFLDVNGDGTDDVFIGGRSPNFKALNGKDGSVIWEYTYHHENDSILKHARYNFNNTVLVPDQSNDGLPDILAVNGGNSLAVPGSDKGREPGVMMLFDSRTGNIIAADTMPDGKETYMSPISINQPGSKDPVIIFGTGGETIDGSLYAVKLSSLINKKLSDARVIASEKGHGFIAPPSAADINNDGYLDIVTISHAGSISAIDGKTYSTLWKQKIPSTESSNSFAVGNFNNDEVPDFFTFVSKGEWPNNTGSLQIMIDGKDGHVAYRDSVGCTGFSSPVVYDLDGDGIDEAIISINEFDCNKGFVTEAILEINNKVMALNFNRRSWQIIDQTPAFKNIFSTPWLGDMDNNGYLDVVYNQFFSRGGLLVFLGMRTKRVEVPVKMKDKVLWGAYMGSDGSGCYIK